tara:strand:- start:448 stop:678 length:231 start_codon:yes stop_codon:yes gene_type:complete
MSIHYDKLTFTKEQVIADAKDLNGILEEDELFYSITFPFGSSYTLSDANNQEKVSKTCGCSHFTECKSLTNCKKNE